MPHADSSYLPDSVITKAQLWAHIHEQLGYLIASQRFYLASEFVPHSKPDPSGPRLLLGPFCGRPACQFIRAQPGKGVCADAFVNKSTVLVKDVEAYPGHIACDGGTRSEIVSPIFAADGRVVGVLDLDCLKEGAFEEVDREGVEKIAKLLGEGCDW
ncbi:hypothetical protein RhiTH_010753 [Rhizoctonia solani]